MGSYRQTRTLLIGLTVCVWFAALAVSAHKFGFAARSSVKITLQTSPSVVRIFVNNRPEFSGNYVQTPTTFVVSPGKNKIKIQREGFSSQVITVTGSPGDTYNMESVVLGQMADTTLGFVRIESKLETQGVSFSVGSAFGSGLAIGEIPSDIADLLTSREYELTLSVPTQNGKKSHRCYFLVPETATIDAPYLISVYRKGSRIKTRGCKTLQENATLPVSPINQAKQVPSVLPDASVQPLQQEPPVTPQAIKP